MGSAVSLGAACRSASLLIRSSVVAGLRRGWGRGRRWFRCLSVGVTVGKGFAGSCQGLPRLRACHCAQATGSVSGLCGLSGASRVVDGRIMVGRWSVGNAWLFRGARRAFWRPSTPQPNHALHTSFPPQNRPNGSRVIENSGTTAHFSTG